MIFVNLYCFEKKRRKKERKKYHKKSHCYGERGKSVSQDINSLIFYNRFAIQIKKERQKNLPEKQEEDLKMPLINRECQNIMTCYLSTFKPHVKSKR